MALVLLVIGALMSGAGIYAVIYGYSIIHVEEGWASVISGATLIAGGMVTIALGLVLRTLKQVKAGLLEAPARGATPTDPSSAAAADPAPGLPADTLAAEPAPAAAAVAPPTSTPPFAPEPAFGPAVADYGAASPVASPSRFEVEAGETAKLSGDERRRPSFSAPSPPLSMVETPVIETPRAADDYKLETPSNAEHDLPPARTPDPAPVAAEPASPPMDDWLDRAFAELDRDNPPMPNAKPQTIAEPAGSGVPTSTRAKPVFPPRPSPGTIPKAAPSPEPEKAPEKAQRDTTAQSRAARSETPALEAAVAAPAVQSESARQPAEEAITLDAAAAVPGQQQAASATQSAVIGRYESDGTTYVMFADGSIEAQSASGVYRFASMAELKAYIES